MIDAISPMLPEHLDAILAIEQVSFPTPWSRMAFTSELYDNEFAYYFVGLHGTEPIGYAGMWLITDEAHVTNVAVHPVYRHQGVGRLLLMEMFQQALARGCKRITLEVRPSNLVARSLYGQLGFIEAGIRQGYYTDTKEDAIIMWKDLLAQDQPAAETGTGLE